MDISKIKIESNSDGGVTVFMDDALVERFKLFCLVDFYLAKSTPNWKVNSIESKVDGRIILYCQADHLTAKKKHEII